MQISFVISNSVFFLPTVDVPLALSMYSFNLSYVSFLSHSPMHATHPFCVCSILYVVSIPLSFAHFYWPDAFSNDGAQNHAASWWSE